MTDVNGTETTNSEETVETTVETVQTTPVTGDNSELIESLKGLQNSISAQIRKGGISEETLKSMQSQLDRVDDRIEQLSKPDDSLKSEVELLKASLAKRDRDDVVRGIREKYKLSSDDMKLIMTDDLTALQERAETMSKRNESVVRNRVIEGIPEDFTSDLAQRLYRQK